MRDEFAEYREYLHEGMRLEVGIPLSGGGVFRDWAILHAAHEDEILVQLSRDLLPSDVKVEEGTILDVSVWIKKDAYSCSSIVIEKVSARILKLRLFGSFTLRERRQFFRLDVELRARFAELKGGSKEDLKREWEQRLELEQMKLQGYDQFVISAHMARYGATSPLTWEELPTQANLGGGGIRVRLPRLIPPESLVNLEIHLPVTPPRVIQAVAEVVHLLEPREVRGVTLHPAGMQFVFLHERDRDLIFQHISVMQLEILRKHADYRFRMREDKGHEPKRLRPSQILARSVVTLLFLVAAFFLVRYLMQYRESPPGSEIGESYEKAIKKYRRLP